MLVNGLTCFFVMATVLFAGAGVVMGLMARRVLKKEADHRNARQPDKSSFNSDGNVENIHHG